MYNRNPAAKYGTEEVLQQQVCVYLRTQYPAVLFRSDMGGVRLTMGQARRAKSVQQGRAWPDLFIAEEHNSRIDKMAMYHYHGLFLELKKEGTKVYLKDGVTLVANPHYQEQAAVLQELRDRGYKAEWGIGFDMCKKIIDEYLRS